MKQLRRRIDRLRAPTPGSVAVDLGGPDGFTVDGTPADRAEWERRNPDARVIDLRIVNLERRPRSYNRGRGG